MIFLSPACAWPGSDAEARTPGFDAAGSCRPWWLAARPDGNELGQEQSPEQA
jgi:hypothetical protein